MALRSDGDIQTLSYESNGEISKHQVWRRLESYDLPGHVLAAPLASDLRR
jgi:hypothetical protein